MGFEFEVIEPKLFAGAAADEVVATVLDILAEKSRCQLVLAGGSTPVSVYRALTVSPRVDSIPWDKLDLLFGDERWVPHTDTQSNMRMVAESLVSRLSGAKPEVLAVNTSLASPDLGAQDYEKVIKNCCSSDGASAETPSLDLVLLGMGDDGHTASVFPGSKLMSQALSLQDLVSVEDWPNQPGSYRISMTPRLLLAAKKIIFLVQGAPKAEMLARVFSEQEATQLPAQLFKAVAPKVTWLVDSEAARLLK